MAPGKYYVVSPVIEQVWYTCDVVIWLGVLFRLAAACYIRVPAESYVFDWGQFEYGYHIRERGYRSYVHTQAVLDHDLRGAPGQHRHYFRVDPLSPSVVDAPPIRCYYYVQNNLHFWLREYRGEARTYAPLRSVLKCAQLVEAACIGPVNRRRRVRAAALGFLDSWLGNLECR